LGLPVISISSFKSMPNLIAPTALDPPVIEHNVSTQVHLQDLDFQISNKVIFEDTHDDDDDEESMRNNHMKRGHHLRPKVVVLNKDKKLNTSSID
jgi:hypothetical protein